MPHSRSISASAPTSRHRGGAWIETMRQLGGSCEFRGPEHPLFCGKAEARGVGELQFVRLETTAHMIGCQPMCPVTPGANVALLCQLEGSALYRSRRIEGTLQAGVMTLVDFGDPWELHCTEPSVALYLRIPQWLIQGKPLGRLPLGELIAGDVGLGATLLRLAKSLYREAHNLRPEQGASAVQALFDLLMSVRIHSRPSFAGAHAHRASVSSRVRNYIEDRLSDPQLSPSEIAGNTGISVRHLHRLFSREGNSVSDWIREQRLARCRSDLANSRLRSVTITEIAFRWGFCDSAHFSRTFKQRFGISPRAFRVLAFEDTEFPPGSYSAPMLLAETAS